MTSEITDDDAAPGHRTYRYVNGRHHRHGSIPFPMEPEMTLRRVLWRAFKAWRRERHQRRIEMF